jgi:hypothetical protein
VLRFVTAADSNFAPMTTQPPSDISSGVLPVDSQSSSEFRPSCPSCANGQGTARAVTIRNYEETITYVCDTCENEWAMKDSVHSPSLGLFSGPLRTDRAMMKTR